MWIFKQFTLYISVKLWSFGHFHTFSLFTCSFSPWSDLFSDESKCVTENYVTMFSLLTGRMYLWWGAVFWTIGELREFMFSSRLVASLHRPLHIYGTFPHWEYKGYEAMRGFLALLCSHLHKWTPPRGENELLWFKRTHCRCENALRLLYYCIRGLCWAFQMQSPVFSFQIVA